MYKIIITLCFVFVGYTSSLLASDRYPVGTTLEYKTTADGQTGKVFTTVGAYNSASDSYPTEIHSSGPLGTSVEHSTMGNINCDYLKWIKKNCKSEGGILETLTTPLGTFKTCAWEGPNQGEGGTIKVWWGNVPFGALKIIRTIGSFTAEQELTKYSAPGWSCNAFD